MKYLIPLLLILAGCGTRAPSAPVAVIQTADGTNVYLTRDFYEERFGGSSHTDLDLRAHTRMGHYDPRFDVCYAIARDPTHPTDLEQAVMLHEIGHRLMHEWGWDAARPVWLWLAWNYPALMTHPEINNRLKSEGLWPSIFGPAAP